MEAAVSKADRFAEGLGLPVEIGKIDKALGRLWEEAGETKTRASLMNLVLYTEDREAMERNTQLIATIAGEHACRAILILAEPEASESGAKAWINAHCHLAGKRQVCSEQISFHLTGDSALSVPNVVFSHLDSDLPLYLWWQAEFHEPVTEEFWAWVDRVLFDSAQWKDLGHGFGVIEKIRKLAEARTTLGDINWGRLAGLRHGLAGVFDHPTALNNVDKLDRISIVYAPGFRATALLLLGWIAYRLKWAPQSLTGEIRYVSPSGLQVSCDLKESNGPPISACLLGADLYEFGLRHRSGHDLYEVIIDYGDTDEGVQVVHATDLSEAGLLLNELARNARQSDYPGSIEALQPLLQ